MHANLKQRYEADHIAAAIKLPVADLLKRVVAVQHEQHGSSRILTGHAAAAEVDKERINLGMSLAQFVKHLESEWLGLSGLGESV